MYSIKDIRVHYGDLLHLSDTGWVPAKFIDDIELSYTVSCTL